VPPAPTRSLSGPVSPWRARSPYARAKPSDAAFLRIAGTVALDAGAHEAAFNYFESALSHADGGYGENMEDIEVKKLSLDFTQDRDLEAIQAKVLAFLKDDVAESGTVTCVIREVDKVDKVGDNVERVYRLGLGQAEAEVVETSAGEIASYLAEYAKGKDGKLYNDATLEIHHP
jgi:hypothetical protein